MDSEQWEQCIERLRLSSAGDGVVDTGLHALIWFAIPSKEARRGSLLDPSSNERWDNVAFYYLSFGTTQVGTLALLSLVLLGVALAVSIRRKAG
jgi:hypothetical protein